MDVTGRAAFSQINCPNCGTELTIPVMLGQFLLVERMGSGGMGAVYRALDSALNRFVAIKVMKASLGVDAKLVESFIREAQAAAALNHRNIVQIYSCGQEKGQPYIVMELVTGGKMNHMFTKAEPMDEVKLLKVALDVAEGLKAANEVGLVHGDIKPENVLIDNSGTAKIVDFGLAQFVNAQKNRGEIWGTPYYISPERARGNLADHRSDIYSLGATMFHALSGEPPFDGKTAADVVLARLKHPPPDLKELRPGLQSQTVELINRMMAADPYLRYPNSASLKSDMNAALQAAKDAKTTVKQKNKHKKKSKASLIVAGVTMAVLIGLGYSVVSWYQKEKAKPPPTPVKSRPSAKAPATEKAKPPEPEEQVFTMEEVKGRDGKIRQRMNIKIFSPEEEVRLMEAARMLAEGDNAGSLRKLQELGRELPRNSARSLWIPLLQTIHYWSANDDKRAVAALEQIVRAKISQKEDHPNHMPQVMARFLLGRLSDAELVKYRDTWPAWFGDMTDLLSGMQSLSKGGIAEGQRKLNVYLARKSSEPAWVYGYEPAVQSWVRMMAELEDLYRQVNRQLNAGLAEPARAALLSYQKSVPPMLAGQVSGGLQKAADTAREQKATTELTAARTRRMLVQKDLDRIDAVMAEMTPLIVRNRDYRRVSLSISTLPSEMQTDQGREAAKWAREVVERLDSLKAFLIRSIDAQPFTRADGSDLGGDVISATTLGLRVSLDGRTITTHNWDTVPVRTLVRMAEFYANLPGTPDNDRAEAFVSLALFCLYNGALEPANTYARRAASLQPERLPLIRRLLPGMPLDT